MSKSNFFKRFLPILMAVALVLPSATVFAAPTNDNAGGNNDGVTWETVEDGNLPTLPKNNLDDTVVPGSDTIQTGNVRVSIVVDGNSTIGAGFDTQRIGVNPNAVRYRSMVLARQNALANKISKEVLGGKKLDVVWNITLAGNIISANVPANKIDEIRNLDGVVDVFVENQYEPDSFVEADDPNMSVASGMTGAQKVWANGYTGAGSKVAIIDTGLDTDHELFDAEAFDKAIAEEGKEDELLTTDNINAVLNQLNIRNKIGNVTADDLYLSTKIPFAANYIDNNLDVTHDNDSAGAHGSHVAGIAAANRYVKVDGEFENSLEAVLTQGEAPDAQILVMKVFGKGGGAYDSDYFVAIEDAILLGADSVNLSLGSGAAGHPYETVYNYILENMADSNTVVSISMGNNSYWGEQTPLGYNFTEDGNFFTGGSPGSFKNALTVASIDNDGVTGIYLSQGEDLIFFSETSGYGNAPITTIAGEQEYVYIDAPGTAEQFAAVADKLEGKIGVCNRGEISFYEKANAAVANGAIATIIANNQPGTINMNLTGYLYTAPAISITQVDGYLLKFNATSSDTVEVDDEEIDVYYGTITVNNSAGTITYGSEYYTMSDFSSWGAPGDLSLKPEITAPGGNIYSINGLVQGGQGYMNNSGTSMAAPQIAGLAAVFKEYIRDNDLATKTGLSERQLTNSLLMSTAKALIEQESENYYSVMKQGAGLVDLDAAVNAKTYIMMNESSTESAADGKIKVELGDDPERTGEYTAEFTINNFSDDDQTVYLDAEFFTQDAFAYYTFDGDGYPVFDEDGAPVISTYRDTWTVPLESDVTWYVNGEEVNYDDDDQVIYDFNGDGIGDEDDAQALLDFIVGNRDAITNEDLADIDADGDIDSFDAYLVLKLNDYHSYAYIPANGSVTVKAEITILDADDYDDNGTYIEGYLFAEEAEMSDGALGVTHSIPVLGYYGSWSEFGWDDVGSYIEYAYGLEDRYPYLSVASALGANALVNEAFLLKYPGDNNTYYFGGNPYVMDEEYMPERNAISAGSVINAFRFSQIRNSAGSLFTVLDSNGTELYKAEGGANYAAYYYPNDGVWKYTSTSVSTRFNPEGIADNTELTMNLTLAPEYYRNDDGSVNWDDVHENSTLTVPVVVDNTKPEVVDVEADEELGLLAVTVKDNQYIACVALFEEDNTLIDYYGSDPDADKEDIYQAVFDLSDIDTAHLYALVADYAANETIIKINLNEEELDDEYDISISPVELKLVANNSATLTVSATPWGADERVTWTSSDETVATVSENGLVTGVAAGEATITATSVFDPTKSATCEVTVVAIEKDLNGIVWDEEGRIWFSDFSLATLPAYNKLSGQMNTAIASAAYDQNGTLYAASFDSDEWLSTIYTVDEETYDLTEIGASSIGYMDIAPAPSLGDNILMAVYGPYAVIVDAASGDYLGVFDLSSYTGGNYLVGIAYEEQYIHSTYGPTDWYFLVDEAGEFYSTGFLPYNGSYSRFGVSDFGNLGYTTDTPFFNSLYYDGEDLFWSCFNEGDNNVKIVMVDDLYTDGSIYNAGTFADGVWPVGGLYEKGINPSTGFEPFAKDDAEIDVTAEFIESIESIAPAKASEGGTNAAQTTAQASRVNRMDIAGINAVGGETSDAAAVTLTESEDATNGKIVVTYDTNELNLVSCTSDLDFISYKIDAEAGTVTIAYAAKEALTAGTAIAKLVFDSPCEDTDITVETKERNKEDDLSESGTITVKGIGHDWDFDNITWDWAEDYSSATGTVICLRNEDHEQVIDAEVTSENVPGSADEKGKTIYTATIKDGENEYTDTKEVERDEYTITWSIDGSDTTETYEYAETPEHADPTKESDANYKYEFTGWDPEITPVYDDATYTAQFNAVPRTYGDPEWTWTDDNSGATATFTTNDGDKEFTQTVEAEVTVSKDADGNTVYTAKVTFNGKEYTVTKVVKPESPDTGDHSNTFTWMLLLSVSMIVILCGAYVYRRKYGFR